MNHLLSILLVFWLSAPTTAWTYDAEGRTLTEVHYDAQGEAFAATAYEYDPLGRQTARRKL